MIPLNIRQINRFVTAFGFSLCMILWGLGENAVLGEMFMQSHRQRVANQVAPSEHGGTCTTAPLVTLNTSISDSLAVSREVDRFRLAIPVDGLLTVRTTGDTDTLGTLRDGFGRLLNVDDDTGDGRNFAFSAGLPAGTYCVEVSGFSASTAGDYTLWINFDDYANECGAAAGVGSISTTAGAFEVEDDVDAYRVTLLGTRVLTATTTGETNTAGVIRDSSGAVIAEDEANFALSLRLPAGRYCIEIRGAESDQTGPYVLEVNTGFALAEEDGERLCGTAPVVRPNSVTPGILNAARQVNRFRVTVPVNGVLRLTATGDVDTLGTLRDAFGNILAVDDDGGAGANFDISTLLTAGDYCVEVSGGDRAGSGLYVLVTHFTAQAMVNVDDHGETCATATTIGPSSTTLGQFTFRDVDAFRIIVPAEGVLTVTTRGEANTFATLRDAMGLILAEDEDRGVGGNFGISLPVVAGEYCLEVREGAGFSDANRYVLLTRVVSGPLADDHGGTCAASTLVSPISVTPGNLTLGGDVDAFRVTLPASGQLTVTTVGEGITKGRLRDADGQIVAEGEGTASAPNFALPLFLSAGTYCIEVMGQNTFLTSSYRLVASFASDARDDHADSCEMATRVPLISTTPSALETRGDVDAFRVSLPTSGRLTVGTLEGTRTLSVLRDEAGNVLAEDLNARSALGLGLSSDLEAGDYCIEVMGDEASTTGSYKLLLSFEPGAVDEDGATCETSTLVLPNTATDGVLETFDDVDRFRLHVAVEGVLTFGVIGDPRIVWNLRDDTGILRVESGNLLRGSTLVPVLLRAGDYCIEIQGDDLQARPHDYTLVTDFVVPEADGPETCGMARVMSPNAVVPGSLDDFDIDSYAVALTTNGRLTITTIGEADADVQVRDRRGAVLIADDITEFGRHLSASFDLDIGDYCIEVAGRPFERIGGYALVSTFEPLQEDGATACTMGTIISPNSLTPGALDRGRFRDDVDAFRVRLPESGRLRVKTTGDVNRLTIRD